MPRKKKYIFVFICSIVLFFVLFTFFYVGNYFYNFALKAHTQWSTSMKIKTPNVDICKQEKNKNKTAEELKKIEEKQDKAFALKKAEDKEAKSFFSNLKFKHLFIKSFDNLNLHALEFLNPQIKEGSKDNINHKWSIIIHGYNNNCTSFLAQAKHFYDMGFNLLIVDLRGHGLSEGKYIGMGWHDRLDIKQWINKIIDKDQHAEIVLYGVSMGAATVMMTAGEILPKQVKLGIEDCGYTSAYEVFLFQLKNMFGFGPFLSKIIMYVFNIVTRLKTGSWITDASAIKQLKKSDLPMLFIHGDSDTYVPSEMIKYCYNAHNAYKEQVIVPDSIHAMNNFTEPDLYWNSVKAFIKKYIKN